MADIRTAAQKALEFLKNNWKLLLVALVLFEVWRAWNHLKNTALGKAMGKIAGDAAAVLSNFTGFLKTLSKNPGLMIGLTVFGLLGGFGAAGGAIKWFGKKGGKYIKSMKKEIKAVEDAGVDLEKLTPEQAERLSKVTDQRARDAEAAAEGRQTLEQQQKSAERARIQSEANEARSRKKAEIEQMEDGPEKDAAEEDANDEYFDALEEMPLEG